jgi:DNA-directed RNA polymerase, mitochondrial
MNLIDEQIAIETDGHYEAKARYNKYRLKDEEAYVRDSSADSLLSFIAPNFANAIEEWWTPAAKGKGYRGDAIAKGIKREFRAMSLDSVGFSVVTLKSMFRAIMSRSAKKDLQSVSQRVSQAIHTEESFLEFKEYGKNSENFTDEEKKDWRSLSNKILRDTSNSTYERRRRVLDYARDVFMGHEKKEPKDRIRQGMMLIDLAVQMRIRIDKSSPEVPIFMTIHHARKTTTLSLTPEVEDYLASSRENIESGLFSYYPMVIPPTPWMGMFGGGYATPRGQGTLPLIKTHNIGLYKDEDIGPSIYNAVNTIQETPWRINKEVFAVMDYCKEHSIQIGDLPVGYNHGDVQSRLDDTVWAEMSKEEQSVLIGERSARHKIIAANKSKSISLSLKLSLARRFIKYERLYFPHTLDFRGRIYPVAAAINPQSDKYGQALLTFAEGKALGETGRKWLAIHGANTFGLDSESFDVRLQWVEEEKQRICDAADNPLGTRDWWGKADDPFGFLAFAIEWNKMLKQGGDSREFKSSLPVKLDATSSGLQHYSAIFRDAAGAKATNLADGERSDIYKIVAEESKSILSREIKIAEEPEKKQWLRGFSDNMNRNVCKPPTMCLPYGISLFGVTDALDELRIAGKLVNPVIENLPQRERIRTIRALGEVVMEGVGNVVTSAIAGMDWLKEAQKAVIKDQKTGVFRFNTMLGFPFFQQYFKPRKKVLSLFSGKARVCLTVGSYSNEINKPKTVSSIAPNFIHSQDATHLLKTALMARERGILNFSFIHDSFGTHAADTEVLREVIRESFVWLYEGDTLGNLKEQWSEQYKDAQIPPPPYAQYGTFDIKDCLKSKYMFN